ncbi:MAG: hypothetical protein ABUJ92_03320 [Desulfobacterales bacterium]
MDEKEMISGERLIISVDHTSIRSSALRPESSIYGDSSKRQQMLDFCPEPGKIEAQNLRDLETKSSHFVPG